MAKRYLTEEQMERVELLIKETNKQSKLLDEILLCLKGSESMNIEGIIPAQKRMQKEIEINREELEQIINDKVGEVEDKQDKMQSTINKINSWKDAMTIYIGLFTSRKIWSGIAIFLVGVGLLVLISKYGFLMVWENIKKLVL